MSYSCLPACHFFVGMLRLQTCSAFPRLCEQTIWINMLSNGLRPLPSAPWVMDFGRSGFPKFWSDLGRSSMFWFFEGYGWIRTKKLIWTLPFSTRKARTLSISCPSSFPNLLFSAISGLSKIPLTFDFPRISDFRGGTSRGFDFDKSSTIWNSEAYGWIRMKKLVCLLPFSGQMTRTLSISCPSSFPNLTFWPISGLSKISPTSWCSKNFIF